MRLKYARILSNNNEVTDDSMNCNKLSTSVLSRKTDDSVNCRSLINHEFATAFMCYF